MKGTWCADLCRNCLAGRRHLCPHTLGVGVNRDGCFAEYLCIPMSNVWYADRRLPMDVLSCSDPLGNAVHTALSFDVLGEDVLVTGAGPIGCMAAAIVRHAGARHVVVTDVNPYRLELARKLGATLTLDVRSENLEEAQKKLGMKEGFDVGLEMSGSAAALRSMLANMCHGGKIAMLGIPEPNTQIDWNLVVFNSLTIQGHLWAGNVRDLVQDDGDAAERAGYFPGDHASVSLYRIREGFRDHAIGPIREGDSELGRGVGRKDMDTDCSDEAQIMRVLPGNATPLGAQRQANRENSNTSCFSIHYRQRQDRAPESEHTAHESKEKLLLICVHLRDLRPLIPTTARSGVSALIREGRVC